MKALQSLKIPADVHVCFCTLQETGKCPYGDDCHFAHRPSELLVSVKGKFVEKEADVDCSTSVMSDCSSLDGFKGCVMSNALQISSVCRLSFPFLITPKHVHLFCGCWLS